MSQQKKTPFWREIAAEILGELFIYLFFALVFLFASSIWAVYFLVGWGALFLAIPYLALLYYLYRKACSKQTK